jgi:hypothetical protein
MVCTELGPDPSLWPTTSPLPTPPFVLQAGETVKTAMALVSIGEVDESRSLLRKLDQDWIQAWFIIHAQNAHRFRRHTFHPDRIAVLPVEIRDRPYPSPAMERDIYERDGGRCRFCGVWVVLAKDQRAFSTVVGDDLFAIGRTNLTRSGTMIATRATADHVIPRSQGGRTDPDNLVTACWPCQFGKAEFSPSQLGLEDPRSRT